MNHWSLRLGSALLLVLVTALPGSVQGGQRLGPTVDVSKPPDPDKGLVLLPVSVAGPAGRAIPPIDKKRFHVFEDGVEQKIDYFWVDNRPLTVGFVFDDSDRMSATEPPKIDTLAGVIPAFFETRIPADEYFVATFNTTPVMVTPYTTDLTRAPKMFRYTPSPISVVANVNEGVYLGLELIKEAANPRKILLVIYGDSNSGVGIDDLSLIAYAMKQPVQFYPILLPKSDTAMGFDPLPEIASVTGGLDYVVGNEPSLVETAVREIARGVRTQYLIGFKASHHDGKRRGVHVKVDRPDDSPKLRVWTKPGYVADKRN